MVVFAHGCFSPALPPLFLPCRSTLCGQGFGGADLNVGLGPERHSLAHGRDAPRALGGCVHGGALEQPGRVGRADIRGADPCALHGNGARRQRMDERTPGQPAGRAAQQPGLDAGAEQKAERAMGCDLSKSCVGGGAVVAAQPRGAPRALVPRPRRDGLHAWTRTSSPASRCCWGLCGSFCAPALQLFLLLLKPYNQRWPPAYGRLHGRPWQPTCCCYIRNRGGLHRCGPTHLTALRKPVYKAAPYEHPRASEATLDAKKAQQQSDEEAGGKAGAEQAAKPGSGACLMEAARQRRKRIAMEGAPVLGCVGTLEWCCVFVGLTALFVLQFLDVGALSKLAQDYWLFAAGGYAAAMLGHGEGGEGARARDMVCGAGGGAAMLRR
eukprot:362675-Chlamydomonas_euryale.AAC.6